jgi:hypothetical protein
MAVNFSNTLVGNCGTNAIFQAWAQFIEDSLVTVGGWNLTNDTGQTLPSALIAPTASVQKRGYRVYQLADDLQGTNPVTIRIDFGSGFSNNGAPYSPAVWLTIGPQTDGSGNVQNRWLNSAYVETHAADAGYAECYASADKGRCSISMFARPFPPGGSTNTNASSFAFSIERWKNEAGQDIGGGLMLVYTSRQSIGGNVQICLAYSPSLYFAAPLIRQQPIDLGLNYIHTTNDPSPTSFGDRGVGVLFHFFGTALQPGMNWLICNATDTAGPILLVNMYGNNIPYLAINVTPLVTAIAAVGFGPNTAGDVYRRTLMRYD